MSKPPQSYSSLFLLLHFLFFVEALTLLILFKFILLDIINFHSSHCFLSLVNNSSDIFFSEVEWIKQYGWNKQNNTLQSVLRCWHWPIIIPFEHQQSVTSRHPTLTMMNIQLERSCSDTASRQHSLSPPSPSRSCPHVPLVTFCQNPHMPSLQAFKFHNRMLGSILMFGKLWVAGSMCLSAVSFIHFLQIKLVWNHCISNMNVHW